MPGRRRLIALAVVALVLVAGMACAAYATLTGTWTAGHPGVAAASDAQSAGSPASSISPVATPGTASTAPEAAATSTTAGPAAAATPATGATPTTAAATTTTAAPPATTAATTTAAATTTSTTGATTTTTPSTTTTSTTTTTTTTTTTPAGGAFDAAAEGQFVSSINGLRASQGLAALQGDGGLVSYARAWARHMAETDSFVHSNIASLLGSPWTRVGENIAMGTLWPSVPTLFNALVNSPGHYANMVNPAFTHIGVGVWVTSDGEMWTAHVFAG